MSDYVSISHFSKIRHPKSIRFQYKCSGQNKLRKQKTILVPSWTEKQINVNPLGYIQRYVALNLKPRCLYIPANVSETKEEKRL